MSNIKRIINKIVMIFTIVFIAVTNISMIYADSKATLGTNVALGSPILNNDFVIEDWNRWEFVCWGVFLSNYCKPIIDNYETAFTEGSNGSKGEGIKALQFGSGNDVTNNEVIEALLKQAIQFQSRSSSDLYVAYSRFDGGKITEEYNLDNVRQATFSDMFIEEADAGSMTGDNSEYDDDMVPSTINLNGDNTRFTLANAYVPTFFVKKNDEYVKVLDYCNGWDMAIVGCISSAALCDADYKTDFESKFEEYKSNDDFIQLDSFGNIVTSDYHIILPACANENLRTDKKVNLLNSLVIDMATMRTNNDELVKKLYTGLWSNANAADINKSDLGKELGFVFFEQKYELDNSRSGVSSGFSNNMKYFKELLSADISDNRSGVPVKIELVNNGSNRFFGNGIDDEKYANIIVGNCITETIAIDNESNGLEYYDTIIDIKGNKFKAFDNYIVTSVLTDSDSLEGEQFNMLSNWIYENYAGISKSSASSSMKKFIDNENNSLADLNAEIQDKYEKVFDSEFKKYNKVDLGTSSIDIGNNETFNIYSRFIKVCLPSSNMCEVAKVLSIEDGSNFKVYSTLLYATYLNFYEISYDQGIYEKNYKSAFDTKIFDSLNEATNLNIKSIDTDFLSEEDKEDQITELSYLMLSTEKGRDYRKTLINNTLTDFCFENYNRIVYGSSEVNYKGMSSGDKTGFLNIGNFKENWMTRPLADNYAKACIILMIVGSVVLIIITIIKRKGIFWLSIALIIYLITIIILPITGEIAPYIVEKNCANIFTDNMVMWNLSEMISNKQSSEEIRKDKSEDEVRLINSLVDSLSVIYADRALMLKQDCSRKITQKTGDIYKNINKYQSARWLLPIVIQEFTADSKKANYVYVSLEDVVSDGDNIYYYFETSGDKKIDDSFISNQFNDIDSNIAKNNAKSNYKDFIGYEDLSNNYDNINYNNFSYTIADDDSKITHLYAFYLSNKSVPSRNSAGFTIDNYKDSDDWQEYIDFWKSSNASQVGAWDTASAGNFEEISEQYDREDATTMNADYAYYKLSENNYYYFYTVVRDQMTGCDSLARFNSTLTGKVEEDNRNNFMYATRCSDEQSYCTNGNTKVGVFDTRANGIELTGKTRDILDLKNFFGNVVPYMYQTNIYTGGFDGKSGLLEDKTIGEDSTYHSGDLQSWAYRCNWAVKLMENNRWDRPEVVRDKDGNKYTVNNVLLSECYPDNRPMVFSEAQMFAYGLKESDLSSIELKCVEVNKSVAKKWTYLINYVSLEGMTTDIMYKQMAIIATTEFNKEFTNGVISSTYNLYPVTIDLRYLSFDAILKNILINNTGNMNFAYGSVIDNLMSTGSVGTAILLLVVAFLGAKAVSFMQKLIIAMIFYLGIISIIRNMTADNDRKLKIAGAQLIMNILFIGMTCAYYWIISLLMVDNRSKVINKGSVSLNYGSATGTLWIILIITVVYLASLVWFVVRLWTSRKDMGLNFLENLTVKIKGSLQDRIDGNNVTNSNVDESSSTTNSNETTVNSVEEKESNNEEKNEEFIEQIENNSTEINQSSSETDVVNNNTIQEIERAMASGESSVDMNE